MTTEHPGGSAPAPPAGAPALFGDALPALTRYVGWLSTDGMERGLLGPREVPRLWDRHVVNCAGMAPLVPASASVIDVGSGAGLPGLVLAIVRTDLHVRLVDATARRTALLAEMVADLGLTDRVTVVTGRVEERSVRGELGRADVVTSRALAPLGRLLGWCLPLVDVGGTVLAMKGSRARDEIDDSAADLRRLRARVAQVHDLEFGGQTTTVVEIRHR